MSKDDETTHALYLTDPHFHKCIDESVKTLIEEFPLKEVLTDVFCYGHAYLEPIRDGERIWFKMLDPRYVRRRLDKRGRLIGYYQTLTFPPITFKPRELIEIHA